MLRRRGSDLVHSPRLQISCTVTTMIRAWRKDPVKTWIIPPQRNNSVVKIGSPQADAQPGAGDLQRTDGHADQLGYFPSALAALHQISDLLDSLRRKLYLPAPTRGRGANFGDLSHSCTLCALFLGPPACRL